MKMTGARILLECLKREGVDTVFGYPGGAVLDIYHDLNRDEDLRHILVRHEQAAAHAADGYARASGKVGVVLVTSGPGATNIVTGLATAYADSIPVVAFTGQVHTHLIGNDAFQEVDIIGITRPCTKHNFLVKDIHRLALTIREAFHLARSGRPGPVLVDLPKNVMTQSIEFEWPEEVHIRSYNPTYRPNLHQLRRAADLIASSERPLLLAGGGVISSNASGELRHFARDFAIPVTSTLMGLGAFPGTDKLFLGMLGMHGTYAANNAVNQADLIIAAGARFDDRVTGKLSTFAPKAKIIHIDIDPTSIRKNVAVEVPIVGDCALSLEALHETLLSCHSRTPDFWSEKHAAWLHQLAAWREAHPLSYHHDDKVLKPQQVVEAVQRLTAGKAVYTTEVGQNQMWAAQFLTLTEARTFLTSGGLGTMGYGLPAAIGAQFALPDKKVIDIAGDASIQMNIQEMMTVVCHHLPIKVVILNNSYLGMVRQWQELFYERNYSFTSLEGCQPDFVKLAEAYGAEGYRITTAGELAEVLPAALASPSPALIDVHVAREENVYPIVPAGAALDEMQMV